MKSSIWYGTTAIAVVVVFAASFISRAQAGVADLSYSANGFALNPSIALTQGSAVGIADGTMFDWGSGAGTSPRDSGGTTISPYMTWSTPQTIGSVRVW